MTYWALEPYLIAFSIGKNYFPWDWNSKDAVHCGSTDSVQVLTSGRIVSACELANNLGLASGDLFNARFNFVTTAQYFTDWKRAISVKQFWKGNRKVVADTTGTENVVHLVSLSASLKSAPVLPKRTQQKNHCRSWELSKRLNCVTLTGILCYLGICPFLQYVLRY